MAEDALSDETTIVATYSTRRDAEMAQDYLEEENIQAFITADDAGGMHPQLQQIQGVKLVALRNKVQEARWMLDDAGLLPEGISADSKTLSQPNGDEQVRKSGATAWEYITVFVVALLFILGLLIVLLV